MYATSRLGMEVPQEPDNVSDGPADFSQAFNTIDNAALWTTGTLAARPPMPVAGSLYLPSDQTGVLYHYNGTAWQSVTIGLSGPVGSLPAAGVEGRFYYATDTGQPYIDSGAAWLTLSTVVPGSWSHLTLGTNISGSITYAPIGTFGIAASRLEGDVVRLSGVLETTNTVAAGSVWATLPGGMRPTDGRAVLLPSPILNASGTEAGQAAIKSNGTIVGGFAGGFTASTGSTLSLDGFTFTLAGSP